MFNDQQRTGNFNNNNYRPSTNTTILSSFGDDSHFIATCWNQNMSVRLSPKIGTDERGLSTYADLGAPETKKTGLSPENMKTLYVAIEDNILPAIEKKEEKSVTIYMGNENDRKSVTIKTDAEGDQYIIIATGLDANNMAVPGNIISHKFNKKNYTVDYSPETGQGAIEVLVNAEFREFVDLLKNANLAVLSAHGAKYAPNMSANTNGQGFNGNRGNYGGYSNSFNKPSGNIPTGGNEASVNTFNSSEDFLPFQ